MKGDKLAITVRDFNTHYSATDRKIGENIKQTYGRIHHQLTVPNQY